MKNLGKTLQVGIVIGGEIGRSLEQSIRQTRSKLQSLGGRISDIGAASETSLKRVASSRLWQGAAAGAGVFTVALGGSLQVARELELALGGVRKFMDLGPGGMDALQGRALDIARKTGVRGADVAGLFSQAAESGKSEGQLAPFSDRAARMSNAFGVSPSEAMTALNQTGAATGQNLQQLTDLFDRLNLVSDSTSTTAPRLLEVTQRVAGLSKVAKVGTGTLTSLGATMLDAGVGPEVTATSLTNMFGALTAGTSATNTQRKAFQALGLTAEGVSQSMQVDGSGTILDILSRLDNAPLEKRLALQNELFGKEARGLTALVNGRQKLLELEQRQARGEHRGSVDRESARFLETSAGQSALLRANTEALGASLGRVLTPALNRLAKVALPVLERAGRWAERHPRMVAGIVAIGGALSALVIAAPALAAGLTLVKGAGALLLGLKLGATIAGWLPVIVGAGKVLLALATGPVGLVALGVLGIGAAVVWLYNRFGWFKAGVDGYLAGLVQGWRGAWTFIVGLATGNMAKVREGWGQMVSGLGKAFGSLLTLVRDGFAATFRWVLGEALAIPGKLAGAWRSFQGLFTGGDSPANGIRPIPRAMGGRVRPGTAYLVGERRPEVVQFGDSGVVHPRVELAAAGAQGSAAPVFNVSLTVNAPGADPDALERALAEGWKRIQWQIQSDYRSLLSD